MQWRRGLGACQGVAWRLASRLAETEGRRLRTTRAIPPPPAAPAARPPLCVGPEPLLESRVTSHTPQVTSRTPQATSHGSQHTSHESPGTGPQVEPRGRGRQGLWGAFGPKSQETTWDLRGSNVLQQKGERDLSNSGLATSRGALSTPAHLVMAFPRYLSTGSSKRESAKATPGPDTATPAGPDAVTPGSDTVTSGTDIVTSGAAVLASGAVGSQEAQGADGAQEADGAQGVRPGEATPAEGVVPAGQGGGGLFRRAVRLREVVIVGAARTAVGSFQGGLASFRAPELGGSAIAGALLRAGLAPSAVQEVIMGNVLGAGLGQAPAKQAAQAAGVPDSAACTTVNKVCASGLKAVALGAQSVALGVHSVVVAGGMESMSQAPFLLPRSAPLRRAGDVPLLDSLAQDGLRDFGTGHPMGVLAQECVDEMRISREDQDEAAISSYIKALAAEATGKFRHEIVSPVPPVVHPRYAQGRAPPREPLVFDEELKKFDPDKLRSLPPAFLPGGSITAGNASSLADGAAALVLTSAEYAAEHGLPILARILGWADAEQEPERFPTSPSLAIPLALQMSGLHLKDAELFEINEAFAAVTLANAGLLGLQEDKVNVHGGAVALGHPLGASGARILVSLLTALGAQGEDVGVAAVCNGGGGASALVMQREPSFRIPRHEHRPEDGSE